MWLERAQFSVKASVFLLGLGVVSAPPLSDLLFPARQGNKVHFIQFVGICITAGHSEGEMKKSTTSHVKMTAEGMQLLRAQHAPL